MATNSTSVFEGEVPGASFERRVGALRTELAEQPGDCRADRPLNSSIIVSSAALITHIQP